MKASYVAFAAFAAVFLFAAFSYLSPASEYCNLYIKWTGSGWLASCGGQQSCDAGKTCMVDTSSGGDTSFTTWRCECCTAPNNGCAPAAGDHCRGELTFSQSGWTLRCIKITCPLTCHERDLDDPGDPWEDPESACECDL
jgi:hypothetical protein